MTHRPASHDERERGSATAELAVALPAVVVLLVALLVLASAATTQLRCADAARAGARIAALGEDEAAVDEVVTRLAGARAEVELGRDGDWVTVSVTSPSTVGALHLAPVRVAASATAWVEP
ncbi:TadE family type IV pilus minor pilin [Cellulomonas chengniuliangii]|uniref:Pilus assembly protein n=1 Tax=Cellulomonas chengniuliangii TaxID=2968084 RepID=A0ABY5KZ17_9CELL|nr:TadE family type IV pilus minor pilin [Cellulomonas chengniuliangii]MCC2309486.1 pilus assembly protein [Cellulomonas chengniuliangii]UUI74955.1 pilus assembly protein [Cellulomonas chengniuliangii]